MDFMGDQAVGIRALLETLSPWSARALSQPVLVSHFNTDDKDDIVAGVDVANILGHPSHGPEMLAVLIEHFGDFVPITRDVLEQAVDHEKSCDVLQLLKQSNVFIRSHVIAEAIDEFWGREQAPNPEVLELLVAHIARNAVIDE
jgi:hypothetical protein